MSNGISAAERAMQILAEIEYEESAKDKKQTAEEKTLQEQNIAEVTVKGGAEVKARAPRNVLQQTTNTPEKEHEQNILNLSNINQNDILNGFIFSEIFDKPLALRRFRR